MSSVTERLGPKLECKFEELDGLSREELVERHMNLIGSLPYKGIRNATLIRAIAYQEQVKTFGDLKPSISRKLIKIAQSELSVGEADKPTRLVCGLKAPIKPKVQTQIGSRLVREWNGRTYEVVVADTGFVLNGITHTSLSACAKAITGAHWSGPRFFGVAA